MPQFIEGVASIGVSADYLKLPVRRDDKDLKQMLLKPLPLIVLQYRHERMFSTRIRDVLRSNPRLANAGEIAAEVHTSSRSLYRHLADDGTSLQQIYDEVRRDLAKIDWYVRRVR